MWRLPVLAAFLGRAGLELARQALLGELDAPYDEGEEERSWFIPAGGGPWDPADLRDPIGDFGGGD